MGLLTETPDTKFFTTLPNLTIFHDSVEAIKGNTNVGNIIKDLGKIFTKHGQNDQFGLVLVHRHFDLQDNEILVESLSEDETLSLAIPWVIGNGNEAHPGGKLHWNSCVLKEEQYIIPQTWSITQGGQIKSFEYLSSPEQLPNPQQEFVGELYEALKSLGLEAAFGIRRLGILHSKFAREITPKHMIANVTEFIDSNNVERVLEGKKEGFIPVMWAFDDEGGVRQVADCSSSTT